MASVAERHEPLVAEQDRFARARAGAPAPVLALRQAAAGRFASLGLPTTRLEDWRFTNIGPIAETTFRLADPAPGEASALVKALGVTGGTARLVVVNGRFEPALSSLEGLAPAVRACGLATAMSADASGTAACLDVPDGDHPFIALNTSFLDDGLYLEIAPNAVVEGLVHLVYVTTAADAPVMTHPRTLILAGEHSRVSLAQSFVGPEGAVYFTNTVTDVRLAPGAFVDIVTDQREAATAFHVSALRVDCGPASEFHSRAFTLGGRLVRNDLMARLGGEGAHCTLDGVYLGDEAQLIDNHTAIDHAMPHCTSHELYKGILDDHARAVFNGRIIVRLDAQKTDAKQTNRALLLSDTAQINSNPQLEIFADDVKCTHGAAVGQLDDEAMFYLQARGLTSLEARDLLLHAFAGEVLQGVADEPLRGAIEAALFERLERDLARHDAEEGRR
jgi:Fe-S cluster assembly protein SufD